MFCFQCEQTEGKGINIYTHGEIDDEKKDTADAKGGRPFIVGIKDREHSDNSTERWDMASLREEEAKLVYELLKKHFEIES